MPKLTMELKGVPPALRKTGMLAKALDRCGRKLFGEVGMFMVDSAKKNFSEERSPTGKKWTPLAQRTIDAKGHRRKLFQTGAMNRGIQIVSLDKDSVSVGLTGTEAKKGLTHQFGRDKIDNVIFDIPAHKRKAHKRMQGGKSVKVKGSTVKAHKRRGSLSAIPERPFLGFSKHRKDTKKISQIASRHLRREAERIV